MFFLYFLLLNLVFPLENYALSKAPVGFMRFHRLHAYVSHGNQTDVYDLQQSVYRAFYC